MRGNVHAAIVGFWGALLASLLVMSVCGGTLSANGAEPPSPQPPPLSLAGSPFSGPLPPTPEQLAVDAQSRTAFAGLDREAAIALAVQDFHVDTPAWTPPGHDDGGHIARYLGEDSLVEALPSGRNVVVDSTVPLRVENGPGQQVPVSLSLVDQGSAYAPASPLVPVSISKEVSSGVSFSSGISVAPALTGGEAPTEVGNRVVFANAARDTDFMAEPLPSGAEVSWLLRSEGSPQDESLAFHLPPGASLQASPSTPGGAEVLEEGKTRMFIPPATAVDANQNPVATSYQVSGDMLTTHVSVTASTRFPVLIDPTLVGYYGSYYDAGVWSAAGWWHSDSCGGCFEFRENSLWVQAGAYPSAPGGSDGEWGITAPGAGQPGGAGITRVDLEGVNHWAANESNINGAIADTNGSHPIYSFNGTEGASGYSPLNTGEFMSGKAIAFCAQEGGGHDGGEPPLCDENYAGQYFYLGASMAASRSSYNYVEMAGAAVTYLDTTPPNEVKMYNITGDEWEDTPWVRYGPTDDYIYGHDQGLGVGKFELQIPEGNPAYYEDKLSCNEPNGFSGCPAGAYSGDINLSGLTTGVYSLGANAIDAAGNRSELQPAPTIYIDHTPPVISPFTGPLAEARNGEVGDGSYTLNFEAQDGSSSAPQAGVAKMYVDVDGTKQYEVTTTCPSPQGIPTSGCFGMTGSWTFSGQKFGAGVHTITVSAVDWVGNESSRSMTVSVTDAAYQQLGPGSVNLATGDYRLEATDASVSGGTANLSVGRVYDSRFAYRGADEPLGEGWRLSLPVQGVAAWQSATPLPDGSVALQGASGAEIIFTPNGSGGYVSPTGYETYTLTETKNPVTYKLTDGQGNATTFTQPSSGADFVPKTIVQASGAGGINKVTYTFTKTSSGVTEPTQILAPEPTEGSCTSALVKGCRALTFSYATSTTATGEKESQWGEYAGNLAKVYFHAWDPSKGEHGEMTETVVAQYAYDSHGKLRAEWDPGISPALKMTYGYDSENHVVSMTPPGQETWAFTYGSTPGDSNTGRLMAVTRPNAATTQWNGEAPVSGTKPAISGTPIVGVKLSVTNGTWGNEPVTYSYQWWDCKAAGGSSCCNTSGHECAQIPSATNPTYTPTASDVGHTLGVRVFAINGDGSVESLSTLTSVVQSSGTSHEGEPPPPTPPRWTVEYHVPVSGSGAPYAMSSSEVAKWGQTSDDPNEATAIFPPDEVVNWPAAEYRRATVYYLDNLSNTVNVAQPGGGISTAEYDTHDNVTRTLTPANRQTALEAGSGSAAKAELLSTHSEYSSDGSELTSTLGPQHIVKLAVGKEKHDEETLARKRVRYYYEEGAPEGGPYRLVTKTVESAEIPNDSEPFDSRTTTTSYSGQSNLGWKLHLPTATTADPNGLKLTSTKVYEPSTGTVKEATSPVETASYKYASQFGSAGGATGQFATPKGMVFESKGNFWIADDGNHRIQEFNSAGVYQHVIGSYGEEPGKMKDPKDVAVDSKGNIWVADTGNNRIQEFKENRELEHYTGTAGTGIDQFSEPKGIAVDSHNNVWVADSNNNRIEEFNEKTEFVEVLGWGVSNGEEKLEVCTSSCRAGKAGAGEGEFKEPHNIAFDSKGDMWVSDSGNNRIEEFKENKYERKIGSEGSGTGKMKDPQGIAFDSKGNLWVTDVVNNRVEEFNEKYEYVTQFGTTGSGNGQFSEPRGIGIDAQGNVWVVDTNNDRVEKWVPNTAGPHTTRTIYYTAAANSEYPGCGGHAEWANLPCQSQPGAQPETAGLPPLLVTAYTYNVWDEPATTTDTSGSNTRTTTVTYDEAGRTKTTAITATSGTALPTITDKYNPTLGGLEEQSTTVEGKTKKITSFANALGETVYYTDADENTTTYEYDEDGRVKKINDGKGTEAFTYSNTTGSLTELVNEYGATKLTFTATYNADEKILNEGYPNGMTVKHAYNSTDEPTSLEDVKTTHCTEKCSWFTDSVTPSIHSQWITQASTLSGETYGYDSVGRLTEVEDTPAGKGCTTRLYAYDEDTNRMSLTTREPGTGGACASTGGTTETHVYDAGNRLDDAGVAYDPWGNTTKLSAADAGGGELTSTYYTNNRLATQTQNEQTLSYGLDPALRTREIVSTGKTSSTVINHYAGSGGSPAWTVEPSSGHYTREISGIGGGLAATQNNTEAPVLQVADLHGDIIATASSSETGTGLTSTTDTTEYGVPTTSTPPKYSWLGTDERPTELSTGIIAMGARSYVPQLGRFLQTDPVPGGSANIYAYTDADPVNSADPSGADTITYGSLSDVSTGPGVEIPEGHDTIPGAIIPPPTDLQAEEALVADPPWPAASAYNSGPAEEETIEIGISGGNGGFVNGHVTYAGGGCTASWCHQGGHGSPNEGSAGNSGCRSGGSRNSHGECQTGSSSNTGLKNACELVGVAVSLASFPESVPATVARAVNGGGAGAAVACRSL